MGACTYPVCNVRDPTTAEAYACLHGVRFASELGFSKITVEGDSLTVLKKLRNSEADRSIIGGLIDEIKERSRAFSSIEFRHIPREKKGGHMQWPPGEEITRLQHFGLRRHHRQWIWFYREIVLGREVGLSVDWNRRLSPKGTVFSHKNPLRNSSVERN